MKDLVDIPSAGDSRRTDIPAPELSHRKTHRIDPNRSRSTGLSRQDNPLMGLRDKTFLVVEDKTTQQPQP